MGKEERGKVTPFPGSEGGRSPSGDPGKSPARWSNCKKEEVVLRLLRGESLDELSRELKVPAAKLASWREDFLEAGRAGLKSRLTTPEAEKLAKARAKIGELTMKLEVVEEVLRKKGVRLPRRRS